MRQNSGDPREYGGAKSVVFSVNKKFAINTQIML